MPKASRSIQKHQEAEWSFQSFQAWEFIHATHRYALEPELNNNRPVYTATEQSLWSILTVLTSFFLDVRANMFTFIECGCSMLQHVSQEEVFAWFAWSSVLLLIAKGQTPWLARLVSRLRTWSWGIADFTMFNFSNKEHPGSFAS